MGELREGDQTKKWFQVIRFPARSPPACTALSFAIESAGRFACGLPCERFLRPQDQCLQARRVLPLSRDRVARNGLSLARNGCHLSATSIPGSTFLTCYFAPFQNGFGARSAFPLRYHVPGLRRSRLLQRVRPVALLPSGSAGRSPRLRSPSGLLHPSGSKRSTTFAACWSAWRIRPISLRSPPPSFASLVSDQRSRLATFPPAGCSSNLLEPHSLCAWRSNSSNIFLAGGVVFSSVFNLFIINSLDKVRSWIDCG